MYLDALEVGTLLKKPYFSTFLHKSLYQYALYRGHFNAQVLTLRYSVLAPTFTKDRMITSVINEVLGHFPSSIKAVRSLIEYDVLLRNALDQMHGSYYFWRANSNINQVPNQETMVSLDHDSIFLFIRSAADVLPTDLDIFFANSNVVVHQITSIIFSFISV